MLPRYVIEKKEKLGTRWLKCCKTPDKQTQFKVTDVDEGSEVQFQVRAENEAGVGEPSEPTEILTIEDATSKRPSNIHNNKSNLYLLVSMISLQVSLAKVGLFWLIQCLHPVDECRSCHLKI